MPETLLYWLMWWLGGFVALFVGLARAERQDPNKTHPHFMVGWPAIFVILGACMLYRAGDINGTYAMRNDAEEAGHAGYYLDPDTRQRKWRWLEPETKP